MVLTFAFGGNNASSTEVMCNIFSFLLTQSNILSGSCYVYMLCIYRVLFNLEYC